jgi:hypothetical protein
MLSLTSPSLLSTSSLVPRKVANIIQRIAKNVKVLVAYGGQLQIDMKKSK